MAIALCLGLLAFSYWDTAWDTAKSRIALFGVAAYMTQNLVVASVRNQPEEAMAFTGVLMGLGAAGCLAVGDKANTNVKSNRFRTAIMGTAFLAALAVSSYHVILVSWRRDVHDIIAGSVFDSRIDAPILRSICWSEPTVVHGVPTSARDVEQLVDSLRQRYVPFAILIEWTILYAVLDQPPPTPMLWYHHGLTYPLEYDAGLDRQIVEGLVQDKVQVVVIEENPWNSNPLSRLPLTFRYMFDNFEKPETIGPFKVFVKSSDLPDLRPR